MQFAFDQFLHVFPKNLAHFVFLFCLVLFSWLGGCWLCRIRMRSTSPRNVDRRHALFGTQKNYSSNKHLSDYTSNIENVVSICNHTPAMGRKADVGLHLLLICLRFSRNITIISKDKTHVP